MKKLSFTPLFRFGSAGRKHYRHAETQQLANAISRRVFFLGLAVWVSSLVLYCVVAYIDSIIHGVVTTATAARDAFSWLFAPGPDGEAPRVSVKAPFVAMVVFSIFIAAQRLRLCLQATDIVNSGQAIEPMKTMGTNKLRSRWESLDSWEVGACAICVGLLFGITVGNMQPQVLIAEVFAGNLVGSEALEIAMPWVLYFTVGFGAISLIGAGLAETVTYLMIPEEQRKEWGNSRYFMIGVYFDNVIKHIERIAVVRK